MMMRHYECHAREVQIMVKATTIKCNRTAMPTTEQPKLECPKECHDGETVESMVHNTSKCIGATRCSPTCKQRGKLPGRP